MLCVLLPARACRTEYETQASLGRLILCSSGGGRGDDVCGGVCDVYRTTLLLSLSTAVRWAVIWRYRVTVNSAIASIGSLRPYRQPLYRHCDKKKTEKKRKRYNHKRHYN